MADTAAYLVDQCSRSSPYATWVLTVPWSLGFRMAYDPELTGAVLRVFVGAIFGSLRCRAGCGRKVTEAGCGAVSLVQRFGGAMACPDWRG